MTKKKPSAANVLAALPAVQKAIKGEIAARQAAGDEIGTCEGDSWLKFKAKRDGANVRGSGGSSTKRKSAA